MGFNGKWRVLFCFFKGGDIRVLTFQRLDVLNGHKLILSNVVKHCFVHDWGELTVNFTCRMCAQVSDTSAGLCNLHWGCWDFFIDFTIVLFYFILATSLVVGLSLFLEKCKRCKETNLLLLLPVLSSWAVSLRRGTCVLSQGEVLLMAYCPQTGISV